MLTCYFIYSYSYTPFLRIYLSIYMCRTTTFRKHRHKALIHNHSTSKTSFGCVINWTTKDLIFICTVLADILPTLQDMYRHFHHSFISPSLRLWNELWFMFWRAAVCQNQVLHVLRQHGQSDAFHCRPLLTISALLHNLSLSRESDIH